MTYPRFKLTGFIVPLALLFFFSRCSDETPTSIGLEFQDDKSASAVVDYKDSTNIQALTELGWSTNAKNEDRSIIGRYYDPVFGDVQASVMAEIRQLTTQAFERVEHIDSVLLRLQYDQVFGDSLISQQLQVFELSKQINDTLAYYSDMDPGPYYYEDTLADEAVHFRDTSQILTLHLDHSVGKKILSASETQLETISDFVSFFHGFYITSSALDVSDKSRPAGNLTRINFNSERTELVIHYNDTVAVFIVDAMANNKINLFRHDYQDSRVAASLDKAGEDTVCYIENLGGVNTRLKLPVLEALKDSFPLSLASFSLKIYPSQYALQQIGAVNFPSLMLTNVRSEDKRSYQVLNSNINYDSEKGYYFFDITDMAQTYLMGLTDSLTLYIQGDRSFNAYNYRKVILYTALGANPPELSITYYKL